MSRTWAMVSAAVVLCLGSASCGGASDGQPSASYEGDSGYPVKIVNCGRSIVLEQSPERVVVMNGESVGEISTLVELGVASHVVVNAQDYGASDVPGRAAAIAALPKGKYKPNDLGDIPRAAMLTFKPDLVVANDDAGFAPALGFATRDDLEKIGAFTYTPAHNCEAPEPGTAPTPTTIEDSYAMMRDLGMLFGVTERADKLIRESRARIAAVEAKVRDRPAKNVMIALPGMYPGSTGDFAYVAAHGIWNDILAKAGGVNPFDDPKGEEKFVPDGRNRQRVANGKIDALIFVNYRNRNPARTVNGIFLAFPRWPAARTQTYLALSDSIYLGPSNHVAVERIARMLHPEVF